MRRFIHFYFQRNTLTGAKRKTKSVFIVLCMCFIFGVQILSSCAKNASIDFIANSGEEWSLHPSEVLIRGIDSDPTHNIPVLRCLSGSLPWEKPDTLLPEDETTHVPEWNNPYGKPVTMSCMISQNESLLDKNLILLDAGQTSDQYFVLMMMSYTNSHNMEMDMPLHFENGARHTIIGKVEMGGYIFQSSDDDPLVFKVDYKKGYVYQSGTGTVTKQNGELINLDISKRQVIGKGWGTVNYFRD